MAIGWSPPTTWSVVGAGDVQAGAGPTRWSTDIALDEMLEIILAEGQDKTRLDFANAAGITSLAQSRFGVHRMSTPVREALARAIRSFSWCGGYSRRMSQGELPALPRNVRRSPPQIREQLQVFCTAGSSDRPIRMSLGTAKAPA